MRVSYFETGRYQAPADMRQLIEAGLKRRPKAVTNAFAEAIKGC
jgi:hypothetical protein